MRWALWFIILLAVSLAAADPVPPAASVPTRSELGAARAVASGASLRASAVPVAGAPGDETAVDAAGQGGADAAETPEAPLEPSAPVSTAAPALPLTPPPTVVTAPGPGFGGAEPAVPAALPSASASPLTPGASVVLGDATVFSVRTSRGGRSTQERARLVSQTLSASVEDPRATDVRVVPRGDVAIVYVGSAPLVELTDEDARLAGDSSLEVHAARVAAAAHQALTSERQRSRLANNVFSASLVVFFALIAFYVMRKTGQVAERLHLWLDENGDRWLTIRVQQVEVVRPAMLKSTALVVLALAKWLAQFGVVYAWLVIVLSLFEATRGYTERLTGFVVTPLSQFMARLATALPLLVVACIAAIAVFLLLRFVDVFFASVARRESSLAWLPADLAAPTSVLLRIGIVIAALVFAAPIVTGDANGSLGRAGSIALIAIGLSATPLLACGCVGSVVLFGRRLRIGEHAEVAGVLGRISGINLLEVRLETMDQSELRIPHLLLLSRPLRGLGYRPRLSVDLLVTSEAAPRIVQRVLDEAAGRIGRDVRAEIVSADADGTLYRVSATCERLEQRSLLALSLLEGLSAAGVPLGRSGGVSRHA